jgi:magnesium chelatase subunit D
VSLYPFTAIVDQERLVEALLVNAVNPAVGGVLVEGPSGTGKSTAVRGLAELLPEIEVVADCPFSCDPADPCPACRERVARGERLGSHRRRVRVVDLPLNATEDRVAGSVDIARALREGVMALEPGLLAEANRGILYVDEINLLDDHLCDVLLDAAALGVNVVEREGVSVSHPARFLLVGTMNPEEGDLRPQLADRIGLRVVVEALQDISRRAEVIRRREAFTADPSGFAAGWADAQERLGERIADARERMGAVSVAPGLYRAIARLVTGSSVSSHRADVTILQCAKALAALAGRTDVEPDDLLAAAGLALGHRVAIDPFEPSTGIDERLLRRVLDDALEAETTQKKNAGPGEAGLDAPLEKLEARPGIVELDVDTARVLDAPSPPDRLERGAIGRRDRSLVALRRGKYSRPRIAGRRDRDVAFDATVRAAAARAGRRAQAFTVGEEDVRRKVREHRVPLEVCFVVDNSYSLHADRLVEHVKGLVFRLLEDAAARGDRVSLVAFKSGVPEAALALRPTRSLARAAECLRRIPLSGRTPLAAALELASRVVRQELHKRPNARPLVVCVTDGLPNVPLRRGNDPLADVLAQARLLRRARIGCVVVDAVPPDRESESCGPALAAAAGGVHLPIADVTPAGFVDVVTRVA